MEFGLIPNIDQYRENKSIEIQKVQTSTETSSLNDKDQIQDIEQEDVLSLDKLMETEKVKEKISTPSFEYTLTNLNFGFNDSSRDFFVRAIRGNTENQYPTEEMMKLKSYLLNLNESA